MKICTKCLTEKPDTEFYRDKRRINGLQARCKVCRNSDHTDWYKAHPKYHKDRYVKISKKERERHLLRKYNINQAGYDYLFSFQQGRCACCGKQQERAFDVDHIHGTQIVRGLLCSNCNRMIGYARNNTNTLIKASAYLNQPPPIVPQVAEAFIRSIQ
jgi:hypothetical protein